MADFDVVIPDKNEEEFIALAMQLGYGKIVFLTGNMTYKHPFNTLAKTTLKDIKIYTAFILSSVNQYNAARKNFDYVFAPAAREFFEMNVDYIIDAESIHKKDSFHYKNTALNQVHAELAKIP